MGAWRRSKLWDKIASDPGYGAFIMLFLVGMVGACTTIAGIIGFYTKPSSVNDPTSRQGLAEFSRFFLLFSPAYRREALVVAIGLVLTFGSILAVAVFIPTPN